MDGRCRNPIPAKATCTSRELWRHGRRHESERVPSPPTVEAAVGGSPAPAAEFATLALHLHDAHGRALETVTAAIEAGITRFDSATGGYGGCPFAPGAHGNLATEQLVEHLHAAGHRTGIDPSALTDVAGRLQAVLADAAPV